MMKELLGRNAEMTFVPLHIGLVHVLLNEPQFFLLAQLCILLRALQCETIRREAQTLLEFGEASPQTLQFVGLCVLAIGEHLDLVVSLRQSTLQCFHFLLQTGQLLFLLSLRFGVRGFLVLLGKRGALLRSVQSCAQLHLHLSQSLRLVGTLLAFRLQGRAACPHHLLLPLLLQLQVQLRTSVGQLQLQLRTEAGLLLFMIRQALLQPFHLLRTLLALHLECGTSRESSHLALLGQRTPFRLLRQPLLEIVH
mmetsp:Transcript_32622/g.81794  ORF Transcript_32622/g.81794 Transcript_32622/m.81794 type:complete len:252 (+) Transcript_32622:1188-1943(+)